MKNLKLKNTVLLAFFLLITSLSFAQKTTTVTGVVRDAKTNEILPFVNVYFVGTNIGMTSDIDGKYSIETTERVDSIAFSYLAYNTKQFKIKRNKTQALNISLAEAGLDLNVATVTEKRNRKRVKDTAAISLWRKVVRHRATNKIDAADNYYYKDYTTTGFDWFNPGEKLLGSKIFNKGLKIMRGYLQTEENGNTYLPILNKETIQEIAYRKYPFDRVDKTLADQFSGVKNEAMSQTVGAELDKMDPFTNLNVIVGKSFIGPFSPTSNMNYNYFLTDSVERDGDKFYLLTFVGKRKQDFTFLGNAWVHKGSYGVESIEMEISPHIALNHIQTINSRIEYTHTPEGLWVKTYESLVSTAKIDFIDIGTRKNRNKKNQIRIRKVMKRYDLRINTTFPPKFFRGTEMQWEEEYNKRDEAYWEANRPEKLDSISAGVYVMMDSIQNTPFYKLMSYMTYASATSHLKAGPIEFGSFPEFISWNNIEGVRLKLGVRTSKALSEVVQIGGYAAYGFKDEKWKYGITGRFHLPTKNRRWHMLTAQYAADFQMLGNSTDVILTNDNIIASITRTAPLTKLMFIRQAIVSYEKDWWMGFHTRLGYQWRKFYSVENGFQFTTGDGATKIPSFTSSEVRLQLHWGHKQRFWKSFAGFQRHYGGTRFPVVDFEYLAGIKGFLGGDYDYHKLNLKVSHRLSTPIGYLNYSIEGGKIFGDAPYPMLKVHVGNQSILRNAGAYAMMNDFEFVSDTYASISLEHYFDGAILNTIPLMKKLKWRTVFMFKALYGTLRDSNRALIDMPNDILAPNFYAEIGFGVENIFKILRVDFIWRLTNLSNPGARPFGINIVFQPKF